jgi:predicted TIM-barrel fold metal-dependent hydrolase
MADGARLHEDSPAGLPERSPEGLLERLLLRDWRPRPQVRTPVTEVLAAAHPCIDVHNHLGRWLSDDGGWLVDDPDRLIAAMDACNVAAVVNLDGRWAQELTANLDRYDRAYPGRFVTFAHLDWTALGATDPTSALVLQVEEAARLGARGLKVWKDLGLVHRDGAGRLVLPDDARLQPVFARAGELGLPVLIHTADPVAFFDPLDATNERIDELAAHPDWWFGGPGLPSFERLLGALEALVRSTPGTTYVGAHVGGHAEDLQAVAGMLARCPNLTIDIGGRIAELGRTPRAFARLVAAFGDRVLFGTDAYPPDEESFRLAFRFVETDDEAFDYAPGESVPPQGRWAVGAAALDVDLLPAFYAGNARRVLHLD